MISKEARRLTDGIYTAYGSGSGYLFGITPDKRPAVEAIIQAVLNRDSPCPFCGEDGYDKPGLKSHYDHGDCEAYNTTEIITRVF